MASVFTSIKPIKLSHSNFNLSYDNKFTTGFGKLIPVCVKEMLPSDVFRYSFETIVRVHPTIRPLMHRVDIRLEAYFVPNRIIWDQWEDFITGKDETLTVPSQTFVISKNANQFMLADYFGLPTGHNLPSGVTLRFKANMLPFRAYTKIWNTYYRSPDIQDEVIIDNNYSVLSRNWSSNDYFMGALPFILQGSEPTIAQTLGNIPVMIDGSGLTTTSGTSTESNLRFIPSNDIGAADQGPSTPSSSNPLPRNSFVFSKYTSSGGTDLNLDGKKRSLYMYSSYTDNVVGSEHNYQWKFAPVVADGSQSTFSITANQLRRLMATEQFLERNARSGSRYTDQILARFNTFAGDARLDNPEFLGSARSTLAFGEIPNTNGNTASNTQGELAGKGFGGASSKMCKYRAKEHGYFIVLMSLVPKLSYVSNSITKEFSRSNRLDYFTPEFEHIGEQPLNRSELWLTGDTTEDAKPFGGYLPIYTEYRCSRDLITSGMKDTDKMAWHLGRDFGTSSPVLNDSFMSIGNSNSSFNRIFFDTINVNKIFDVDIYNRLISYRPISKYGEPGISYF